MAEIVWTKNEQGEFDFNYLLSLTSNDFVAVVSFSLDDRHFK